MYRPKIQEEQLHKLYVLAKEFGLPMTKVLKKAIEEYLKKHAKLIEDIESK